MDLKLEVVGVPVSDIDRAKKFYQEALGFRLDADFNAEAYEKLFGYPPPGGANFRAVQLTPPGSACSIHLVTTNTRLKPGSLECGYLVTSDIEATRADLVSRGVEVSEPFHFGPKGQTPGAHPEHQDYNSYMTFQDPDGNSWMIQEIRKRLPGR
jgi:catechol 2,3-dioxygenase-like lactoylglutathione lyase family enzyme